MQFNCTIFDIIPENTVGIACCWLGKLGGCYQILSRAWKRAGQVECQRQRRAAKEAVQGVFALARRCFHNQICFSGICTIKPSMSSLTLIWQVRRERAGSG